MITVEQLRKIAMQLPAVTEDINWQTHLCFNVADKMFLVLAPDELPSSASFMCDASRFYELLSKEGFTKHKHLGRYHWVRLDDIKRLQRKDWDDYIRGSYEEVVNKLSKKLRAQLGL